MLIEVETAGALEDRPGKVIEQVEGFKKQGYSRVIVV